MKAFLFSLLVLTSVSGLAMPNSMVFCQPKANITSKISIEGKDLTLEYWGKDEEGKPIEGKSTMVVTEVSTMLKKDISQQEFELLTMIAGVDDFTEAANYGVKEGKNFTVFSFLKVSETEYATLMFVEGWPLPLGTTSACKR